MYEFINGWWELPHNPNNLNKKWGIRQQWGIATFAFGEFYMRDVKYEFIKHATDQTKNELITKTSLTWMFRREEDMMLFLLKWPDKDDEE